MSAPRRFALRPGLAAKLAVCLVVSTAAFFAVFGYLNLRLQRRQSEEMVLQSADRISFSTDPAEVGSLVDKRAEACTACHAQEAPLTKLDRPDRARIFTDARGERVLGLIRPIENQPACAEAACQAHPAERRILGVIDTDLSLAKVDAQLATHQAKLVRFTLVALILSSLVSVLFVWAVAHKPVKELIAGTKKVAAGNLDYRLPVRSRD